MTNLEATTRKVMKACEVVANYLQLGLDSDFEVGPDSDPSFFMDITFLNANEEFNVMLVLRPGKELNVVVDPADKSWKSRVISSLRIQLEAHNLADTPVYLQLAE